MVKGDGDASRLALDYIHNVWFVQHGWSLFQGWALREENTGWQWGHGTCYTFTPTKVPILQVEKLRLREAEQSQEAAQKGLTIPKLLLCTQTTAAADRMGSCQATPFTLWLPSRSLTPPLATQHGSPCSNSCTGSDGAEGLLLLLPLVLRTRKMCWSPFFSPAAAHSGSRRPVTSAVHWSEPNTWCCTVYVRESGSREETAGCSWSRF